jgi:hypothetical protein
VIEVHHRYQIPAALAQWVAELADSGNPYVDQFIHGRAEGPIKLDVRAA